MTEVSQKQCKKTKELESSYTETWPMIVRHPNKQIINISALAKAVSNSHLSYPTTPRINDAWTNDKEIGDSVYQISEQISVSKTGSK